MTTATCKEQLLYEIHDPAAYYTPDVVADFSGATVREVGYDRVLVQGASGRPRPDTLKVSLGYADGFIGEGQISYGGAGAVARGRLALEIVAERFRIAGLDADELRYDLIGVDALHGSAAAHPEPYEVRVRVAGRTRTLKDAVRIGNEVEDALHQWPGRWRRRHQIDARCAGGGLDVHPTLAHLMRPSPTRWSDVKLRDLAHSRTGDKGSIVNVSVIAFHERDYAMLERHVTAERVKELFSGIVAGDVVRYALPQLAAFNFVMTRRGGDSVTRTLALDPHGKTLSSALLEMEIP